MERGSRYLGPSERILRRDSFSIMVKSPVKKRILLILDKTYQSSTYMYITLRTPDPQSTCIAHLAPQTLGLNKSRDNMRHKINM